MGIFFLKRNIISQKTEPFLAKNLLNAIMAGELGFISTWRKLTKYSLTGLNIKSGNSRANE